VNEGGVGTSAASIRSSEPLPSPGLNSSFSSPGPTGFSSEGCGDGQLNLQIELHLKRHLWVGRDQDSS
jgi:hypothetical protein